MAPPKNVLAAASRPPPPVIDPADRLSKLPDEILTQILSFLPAQDAVRTCILARTWRHVWKCTRCLLITGKSAEDKVQDFVDGLLRVRLDGLELAPLDTCEIRFDYVGACISPVDTLRLNRWIVCVLECQIQTLRVHISAPVKHIEAYLRMSNIPPWMVSKHLTKLELTGVWFIYYCIDLDGCPTLEHLEINKSCLYFVRKITSHSLKHLAITSCDSMGDRNRIQICVPHLVSLWLDDDMDIRTPRLERMPELVMAKVHIGSYLDRCHCEDAMPCYHITRACDSDDDEQGSGVYAEENTTKCMVLEGLAQGKDPVLKADYSSYIFITDLRWCPTFSKLKTLVLIEVYWREPIDCSALECMLEHAPLLEKLTLILGKVVQGRGKYKVEVKGYPDGKAKSTKISQHLQIVEINCEHVNERFNSIINFLGALNICLRPE